MRRLLALALALYVFLYRASGGRIGGSILGGRVGLVTHRGARTRGAHTTPLIVQPHGEAFVLVAVGVGAPRNPGWYHNMRVNPDVIVELGRERREMRARAAAGVERDELWAHTKAVLPFFGYFQRATSHRFPIVVLEPA